MANQIDLQMLLRNAAPFYNRNQRPAPAILSTPTLDENADPNTLVLKSPPFPAAAGNNAPSGLPPANVVPVVPTPVVAPAEPVIPALPVVPKKSNDEQLKDILKGVGSDVSTVTPRATKAEQAAVAERVKINQEAQGIQKAKTEEEIDKANDLAANAAKDAANAQREAEVRAQKQAEAEARLKQESDRLDAARADYEQNGTIRSFFGNNGQRIQANLMTGIGAFAAARGSMGVNLAAQNIKQQMDEWHDMELSRIAHSKEMLHMSREDYQTALNNASVELKNKEAAMANVIAKERASILAAHGVPGAAIAGDEMLTKIRDFGQELIQQNQEKLRSVTTSSNATQQNIKQDIAKAKVDALTGKGPNALGKPEQNTIEKLGEFNDYLRQTDNTLKLMKENPELVEHVMRARRQWQDLESKTNIPLVGKATTGLTRLIGQAPQTEEDAISGKYGPFFGSNKTKELTGEEAEKARQIYRGVKNLEVAKGMTFGGVLRDNDVTLAQNIASTISGKPTELIDSLEKFRDNIASRREIITKNKNIAQASDAPARYSPEMAKIKMAEAMEALRRNPNDKDAIETVNAIRASM